METVYAQLYEGDCLKKEGDQGKSKKRVENKEERKLGVWPKGIGQKRVKRIGWSKLVGKRTKVEGMRIKSLEKNRMGTL